MASLEHFLRRLYLKYSYETVSPSGLEKVTALPLCKDKPNRILRYYGSFNPPHVGHLEVLRHGVESWPDLNIVAACVQPMDREHIDNKCWISNRDLLLTHEQRADLWQKDSRFPSGAWVWRDMWPDQEIIRDELISMAREDGFEIKFVNLIGPDNWNVDRPERCIDQN
jgi:hypothetical protein